MFYFEDQGWEIFYFEDQGWGIFYFEGQGQTSWLSFLKIL